ncbi:hypothetical protein [Dielma fastidiosa]|nr:hypothetical protein [Dielma fastidiosa]
MINVLDFCIHQHLMIQLHDNQFSEEVIIYEKGLKLWIDRLAIC